MTMTAVVIDHPGPPDVLALRSVPRPTPGPNQSLVRVHASGVNRADILQRKGLYPAPEGAPQDIPGLEFAGEVVSCGEGSFSPGDRVMGIVAGGAAAEYLVVDTGHLLPTPTHLSDEQAAAIPEAFLTAFDAAVLQGGLGPQQWLGINAVGSGVGTAAVQIARYLGASVIGASRTADKVKRCEALGLTEGVVGASDDLAKACSERLGTQPLSVVVDLLGGSELSALLRCLRPKGRLILVGLLAGRKAELPLGLLLTQRLQLHGTVLRGRHTEEKRLLTQLFAERILEGFGVTGSLRPLVDEVLPWSQVREAHQRLEDNATFGKLVLRHN
jgi:putative PIG3 family NAD(P)H quinone oxidoreductase